ncbi:MAG TPA: NUDIX hydrolase [Pyrinomonadaceae bacterium]|nr:NUDIX hydrolase [Pyrinomonadaceae bacterium]
MLKRLLAGAWKGSPRFLRRAGVWLTQPRFTVTAGVVVSDERGRVLLLRHTLRGGSGWGIPGGFIGKGEQPDEAVRREVREETRLELEEVELAFVRTLRHAQQVECIFRGRMRAASIGRQESSFEVERAEWFERARLPADLGHDQRRLIERALGDGAKRAE